MVSRYFNDVAWTCFYGNDILGNIGSKYFFFFKVYFHELDKFHTDCLKDFNWQHYLLAEISRSYDFP